MFILSNGSTLETVHTLSPEVRVVGIMHDVTPDAVAAISAHMSKKRNQDDKGVSEENTSKAKRMRTQRTVSTEICGRAEEEGRAAQTLLSMALSK